MSGHKYKDSAMQALHGIWSLGATIGPFISQQFLASDHETRMEQNGTFIPNVTEQINTTSYKISSGKFSTITPSTITSRYTTVPFAFVTIGAICTTLSLPFCYIYMSGPKWCKQKPHQDKQIENNPKIKVNQLFRGTMLTLLFLWYYFYLCAEGLPGSFLAAWAIKALRWPKYRGALLTSVLWGAHGSGRVIAIPISAHFTPGQILSASTSLTVLAYAMLLFLHPYHNAVVWISVAAAGLGMSSSFASMVLFASRHISVDGFAAAVFLVGASTGDMTAPVLTGYLFQEYTPKCFLYIIFAGAIFNVLIFILLVWFINCCSGAKKDIGEDTPPVVKSEQELQML